MNEDTKLKFLTNTTETGRFLVFSERTGKTYAVEPILNGTRFKWGSIDPATKKLVNKKGAGKYTGAIEEDESLITEENGFTNVEMLDAGVSPLAAIKAIDDKYPDKE